jgi:hypothetical protein
MGERYIQLSLVPLPFGNVLQKRRNNIFLFPTWPTECGMYARLPPTRLIVSVLLLPPYWFIRLTYRGNSFLISSLDAPDLETNQIQHTSIYVTVFRPILIS